MCGRHYKPNCPNPSSQGHPRPASSAFPQSSPLQPRAAPTFQLLRTETWKSSATPVSLRPTSCWSAHHDKFHSKNTARIPSLLTTPAAATQAPHSLHSIQQPRDPVPMYLRLCHTSSWWSLSPHTHTHPVLLPPSAPATLPTWLADTAAGTRSKPGWPYLLALAPTLLCPV